MKLKPHYIFLITLFFCSTGCEKDIVKKVPESKLYSIYSHHLGKGYEFHVLYPDDFDSTEYYHTLILLDANNYFIEMAELLSDEWKNQFVLVGIKYNKFSERVNDFTYPYDSDVQNSGKADQYVQFLASELLPYLKVELNIKPSNKTLLGHSLTGYFATYILFQQDYENPFDNIIAASPSLWWSDAYIFGLEEKFDENHSEQATKYFTTIGDLEGAMMNTHFNAFVNKVASRAYSKLEFKSKRYKNTSHRNSPIVSFRDGLRFIQ